MTFAPVGDSNRPQVAAFLARHEQTCITLAEFVRRKADGITVITCSGSVIGVLCIRRTLFHCIPRISELRKSPQFTAEIASFIRGKEIACINGEAEGTSFFIGILSAEGRIPAQVNRYTLMTLPQGTATPPAAALPEGWSVMHCRKEDAAALMTLQCAYEKEEVIPSCRAFNRAAILSNLEQTLAGEYVLALRAPDGSFAAKANTNAIGITCIQIGGVYTSPAYRRRRFASLLIGTLARKIAAQHKQPVLFVKNTNSAAKRLYASLGFKDSGSFVIAYFQLSA